MSKKKTNKETVEEQPIFENTVEEQPTVEEQIDEPIVELTPEQKAVKDFCELWNSLKNHNVITDEQARTIHKLWQTAAKRTDYYTHCAVCTINHIKWLKKKANVYGYECTK